MRQGTLIRTFGIVLGAAGLLLAQDKIRKQPIPYTPPDSGSEMFQQYCASCHGADGKGHGPAASALSAPLPDLTKLAEENGGEYPSMRVLQIVSKGVGAGAHGSADMPVWGDVFRNSWQTETQVATRLYNLTRYIETLQDPASHPVKATKTKATPKFVRDVRPSSGSEMYRWYCSSCHGATGTGDGPSAISLKTLPSDLTMIAKNNKGVFPNDHLQGILSGSASAGAHGGKEMPVWGDAFRAAREDNNTVQLRIYNLVNYLRSIQK